MSQPNHIDYHDNLDQDSEFWTKIRRLEFGDCHWGLGWGTITNDND